MSRSALLILLGIGFFGCAVPSLEPGSEPEQTTEPLPISGRQIAWSIHTPQNASQGTLFPIVLRGPEDISGTLPLLLNQKRIPVAIHRGVGSLVQVFDHSIMEISLGNPEETRLVQVNAMPVRALAGILTDEDLFWEESAIIHITDTVTIPLGKSLLVGPGTQILLEENVQLKVIGGLTLAGEVDHPVLLTPATEAAWGSVHLQPGSTMSASHTWWIGGGGDLSRPFGHSQSQPVIRVESATLNAQGGGILDSPGKAFGASDSRVNLVDFLVSRCDTGGEFERSRLIVESSHFVEIPDADGIAEDDDNDALYLVDVLLEDGEPLETRITHSTFSLGEDDGIDHNGARVHVENCWISGFAHEGVAASNGERIRVRDTWIEGCEQGIEAGYGSPEVIVEHCVVVNNEVGLRMGDDYDWEVDGTLTVTNSASVNNRVANVKNHVNELNGPAPDSIVIMCSMMDDPAWNEREGNVEGIPRWDSEGCLTEDSKGKNAGCDHLDIGKLTCP